MTLSPQRRRTPSDGCCTRRCRSTSACSAASPLCWAPMPCTTRSDGGHWCDARLEHSTSQYSRLGRGWRVMSESLTEALLGWPAVAGLPTHMHYPVTCTLCRRSQSPTWPSQLPTAHVDTHLAGANPCCMVPATLTGGIWFTLTCIMALHCCQTLRCNHSIATCTSNAWS